MLKIAMATGADVTQTQAQLARGDGEIRGNAFMMQRGGGVVTCAGNEVYLIPHNDYAAERLGALYDGEIKERATSIWSVHVMVNKEIKPIQTLPSTGKRRGKRNAIMIVIFNFQTYAMGFTMSRPKLSGRSDMRPRWRSDHRGRGDQ